MTDILCYMPTYSPDTEAQGMSRGYERETNEQIGKRLRRQSRTKPGVYMDAIDSVLNNATPVRLVVADGRSTESVRAGLKKHYDLADDYELLLYPEKMGQWVILNDILRDHSTADTKYFVYTSSDVVWTMDWVAEAIKEFERDPKLQLVFPCVSAGDRNLPCQIARGVRDLDLVEPPFQRAARAPVLNAYAMMFRMEFFHTYGGYPTRWRNCFTESFLHYMCEAMGGKMRLMPRGWVFHHNAVDAHGEGNDWYRYATEKPTFAPVMDAVMDARAKGTMTVEFLRDILQCGGEVKPVARVPDPVLAQAGIIF